MTYNGKTPKEFVLERTAAYIDQVGGGGGGHCSAHTLAQQYFTHAFTLT